MYSSLRLVTPPAAELVSLEMAKKHLRVDNADDDELISSMIVAARMTVESWLNRALITQTLLWTMTQDPPSGALPLLPMPLLVLPVILTAPQVLNKPLELPRCPVQSIDSVTMTSQDGTALTLTGNDYTADLMLDPARLRMHWLTVPRYLQHIQVQFVAGYGEAPAGVPRPIIAATLIMLSHFYEQRGDYAAAAGEPPRVIEWLLAPYRVMFFG